MMNAAEIDSQCACDTMTLSGLHKRKRVTFSSLPATLPTRPAGKVEPPRQRPRAGDEQRKIMIFLGRGVAPVGGAGLPASRALQTARDSQLGHRAVLLQISAAWRDKQAADQTRRDIEWLGLPPLTAWQLASVPDVANGAEGAEGAAAQQPADGLAAMGPAGADAWAAAAANVLGPATADQPGPARERR